MRIEPVKSGCHGIARDGHDRIPLDNNLKEHSGKGWGRGKGLAENAFTFIRTKLFPIGWYDSISKSVPV